MRNNRIRSSAGLLAACALGGAVAGGADAATSAPPVSPPTVASIPATVQPLIAKIEASPVNSERYSESTQAGGTITVKAKNGKRHRVTRHVSREMFGEASLAPLVGKTFRKGASGPLKSIGIGSTTYEYVPTLTRKDGGRPWVRFKDLSAAALFPFHGGGASRIEVKAGGTGSYAELIDLLATANGNVSIVGPATVDGQQTTELTAAATPLALIKGLSLKDIEEFTETLEVFVTDSGLPLRVTRIAQLGPITITDTTDVIAVNAPVAAKAPPRKKTIGEAKFLKLLKGKSSGGGKEAGGIGIGI
jgi:hypothetical protein